MSSVAGAIQAGSAFVRIFAKDDTRTGLAAVGTTMKAFGATLAGVGAAVSGLGAVAFAPLLGAAKSFADAGHDLLIMSRRTGIAVDELSLLKIAADQSGTSIETVESGLRRFNSIVDQAAEGSDAAASKVERLGISVAQFQEATPSERISLLADAFAKIDDPAKRSAIATQLLGRTMGTQLLPFLTKGAAGIKEMEERFRKMGLAASQEGAEGAERLRNALHLLDTVVKKIWIMLGAAVAPAVEQFTGYVTDATVEVLRWVKENSGLIMTVFKVSAVVVGAGAALTALGLAFTAAGVALSGLLSPLGLLAVGGLAAGAALYKLGVTGEAMVSTLNTQFPTLLGTFRDTWQGIVDAMQSGDLAAAANIAFLGVRLAALENTQAIQADIISTTDDLGKRWTASQSLVAQGYATLTQVALSYGSTVARIWEGITGPIRAVAADIAFVVQPLLSARAALAAFVQELGVLFVDALVKVDAALRPVLEGMQALKAVAAIQSPFAQLRDWALGGAAGAFGAVSPPVQIIKALGEGIDKSADARAQLEAQLAKDLGAQETAHQRHLKEIKDEIDKSREDLKKLLASAAWDAFVARRGPMGPPRPKPGERGGPPVAPGEMIGKGAAAGTFSAAAVRGLAFAGGATEAIKQATQETAAELKKIRKQMQDHQLDFD